MQQWYAAGYFPGFTRVKRASDPDWMSLSSIGSIVAGGVNDPGARATAASGPAATMPNPGVDGRVAVPCATGDGYAEYATVGHFNRKTGKLITGEDIAMSAARQADMYDHRAKRQLNAFFVSCAPVYLLVRSDLDTSQDYDSWTEQRQKGVKKARPDKSRKRPRNRQPEWLKKLG